jgi:hypothetical protein
MRLITFFEIAPPLRWKPKMENIGALRRVVWLWFSVGYIRADFNMMLHALKFEQQEG